MAVDHSRSTRHTTSGSPARLGLARRLLRRLREAHAAQTELYERAMLRQEPWREELLHWAHDGRLHGTVLPAPGGSRRSVTGSGWCPGLSAGRAPSP